MVEKTNVLFNESDAQLLSRLKNGLVILAATWGRNVLGSRLSSAVHVVGEGELVFVSTNVCQEQGK